MKEDVEHLVTLNLRNTSMTFRYIDMTNKDFPLFFRFQVLQMLLYFQYYISNILIKIKIRSLKEVGKAILKEDSSFC